VEIDYSPFLNVLQDGTIWWSLADAIRLGAGYLPVCDADRNLVPVLRAKSNRVRANERELFSEFSKGHYADAHWRLIERDDGRYVEAHDFLEWLSQYVAAQTQPSIAFPQDLIHAVREATSASFAQSKTPVIFESLTIALEGSFDQSLAGLPIALRQRVEQEFFPMPWDTLSAEQRRSVALQMDYQHDPATEKDRKFWWDFFERVDNLKKQRAEWEVVATPTAAELALKETRLAELKQELARMDAQARLARGDCYPERRPSQNKDGDTVAEPATATRYMAYPKAIHQLTARLGATPEELAAWIWLGPTDGGIAAYMNANELDPPPRFFYVTGSNSHDYIAPLMACWFKVEDIDQFVPTDRYITGAALMERWGKRPGLHAVAFIQAKIAESRLLDIHPIYGGTRGTFSEHSDWPPLESGLFPLAHIERIEVEDFAETSPVENLPPGTPAQPTKHQPGDEQQRTHADTGEANRARGSTVRRDARKLVTQATYKLWQKAYRATKKTHPNKSDIWYSRHIAKLKIAKGRDAETIRKHMKL